MLLVTYVYYHYYEHHHYVCSYRYHIFSRRFFGSIVRHRAGRATGARRLLNRDFSILSHPAAFLKRIVLH